MQELNLTTMEIQNLTRLNVFQIDQVDRNRNRVKVILAKGIFQQGERGEMQSIEGGCSPTLTDEYYHDDVGLGLKRASEVCYHKRRTDIYFIDPVAYSPEGKFLARWPVSIDIGKIAVRFQVAGDRFWERKMFGRWKLTEPHPCQFVPISYLAAFGGFDASEPSPSGFNENPIGRGIYSAEQLESGNLLQAPSVFSEGDPPTVPNVRCKVIGLTPVAPSWSPRIGHAGTYDSDWLAIDWPHYPADFDEMFFNCAPPELQYPGYVEGGEQIEVCGMSPEPKISLSLPKLGTLTLKSYSMDGKMNECTLPIDTVVVNLNEKSVQVSWRTTLSADAPFFFSQLQFAKRSTP